MIRATSLPQAPAAMALGAIGEEVLAEAVGAAVARGLLHLGINWNFAPVLDVNNNPANPVIGERSFGDEPALVSRLAAAWMRGSLAEGVACCVKHFPGHGDTHVDSHHALPTVDKSLAALEALELKPFRALTQGPAAAPAVMKAHIVYPQLDPEHPASLSRRVLTGILRDARAPARQTPIRVICQASVASDGVAEGGAAVEQVLALFADFDDVQLLRMDDLRALSAADLPQDGRLNLLVSNHRGRFGAAAREASPDLHLALWNPFQALDIAAPHGDQLGLCGRRAGGADVLAARRAGGECPACTSCRACSSSSSC